MTGLGPAALAAGFVLIGSIVYDPHVLLLRWPDGHEERIAATSPATCGAAVRAIDLGLWRPGDAEPLSATCAPGDIFSVGSNCIAGRCDTGGRR
jgi:hypothetical protein